MSFVSLFLRHGVVFFSSIRAAAFLFALRQCSTRYCYRWLCFFRPSVLLLFFPPFGNVQLRFIAIDINSPIKMLFCSLRVLISIFSISFPLPLYFVTSGAVRHRCCSYPRRHFYVLGGGAPISVILLRVQGKLRLCVYTHVPLFLFPMYQTWRSACGAINTRSCLCSTLRTPHKILLFILLLVRQQAACHECTRSSKHSFYPQKYCYLYFS